MMDNSYDYWFSKYDSESFEKDFIKVPYNEFLNQLIANSDFHLLPNEPLLSLDSGHKTLQQTLQQNLQIVSTHFLPLLENSRENFLRWVRCVIAYLDCEKMYSIMFWNLSFVPNFLEYRLYASFIRFYKFLISLTQNVIQNKSNEQSQQQQSQLTIKQLAERYQESLYLSFDELQQLQRQMLKVFKPLVSQNPTLIGKIYYFIYHMYDKPMLQLRKDLDLQFGQLEFTWVKKILNENQLAIKFIDAYLNEDKQRLSNKDQFFFEDSQVLKQLTSQTKKNETLYKIDVQDKSLLDKSKKIQFLNQIDNKCKRKNREQKSSVFVENYSVISESMMKSSENKSQKQNEDLSKLQTNSQSSNLATTWDSQFISKSTNNPQNMQNSVLGFLVSDLLRIEKINKQEQKLSTLPQRKQAEEDIQLDENLVEFISKADNKIVAIRDEDITLDDNYKKKRYRIKINKRLEENESPDNNRKQTIANLNQQDNNDDELRRIRARRLLEEQNQFFYEKLRYAGNQDNELTSVKDKDLFRYSFEDSMSEDDDSDEDARIKQKEMKEAKVFVPKNFQQNTQGIVFEKFKQIPGDYIYGGNEKKRFFLNRLFHMNENSIRISGKTLVLDFEERKWELLKQLHFSKKLLTQENQMFNFEDMRQTIVKRDFNFKKKFQNNYKNFYNF